MRCYLNLYEVYSLLVNRKLLIMYIPIYVTLYIKKTWNNNNSNNWLLSQSNRVVKTGKYFTDRAKGNVRSSPLLTNVHQPKKTIEIFCWTLRNFNVKMVKTTKNYMLKLAYLKVLSMKISIIQSQHSWPFFEH